MFLTHNRAFVKGIIPLTMGFKRVAINTGTITRLSALISLPLHCVTWLYALLNRAKPGYRSIIAQSWFDLLILESCSREHVTQSIKCLSILWRTVGRIWGEIIVVGEMHSIFQKLPSELPTTQSYRYCLASCVSVSSTWVPSNNLWKYSWKSLNCDDNESSSPSDNFGALHTGQWGCLIECKWMSSK